MTIYKAKLNYIGTEYEGWQIQPAPRKTIQGELNKSLKKIFKSDEIHTLGSGRTDAGVHALGQIVKVTTPFHIPELALQKALNSHLPQTIRVLSVDECDDFHPTKDAINKTYFYVFYKGQLLPPLLEGRATLIKDDLDWKKIEDATKYFIGKHDFINFSTKGTLVKTTVRNISEIEIIKGTCDFHDFTLSSDQFVTISFTGSGFLKQMVRLLVGTLVDIGKGKITPSDIENFLTCGPREDKLAPVALADGLYLKKVRY